ncbi:FHA domain-containing protein, partial [Microcoleus sp. MOSTC5]|uniref:FHA domain-containing protein n=1 Tax=Microcoleus sp. MOSTC5 TaxID=3055378 RepID=UPI002FD71894
MNQLTFEWAEAGQLRIEAISDQQPSKNPGTVRIGRDASLCDIVLSDFTVSPLHAEFFFDPQQQCFYLRNLRATNPPVVNGLLVPQGQVMLDEGTTIQLGAVELRVQSIMLGQAGYAPTNYATQTTPPPYQPTRQATQYTQPPQSQNPVQPTIPVSPGAWQSSPSTTPSTNPIPPNNPIPPRSNRLSVILGTSAAVLLAVVGGIVIASNQNLIPGLGSVQKQVKIDASNPQCRRITPTTGVTAKLRDQPDRNLEEAKLINHGSLVLELKAESAFVQVQLPDGSQGWVYNDQLQSCSEASTTANPPQSQPSTSQPQPPAQEQPTKEPDLSSKEK